MLGNFNYYILIVALANLLNSVTVKRLMDTYLKKDNRKKTVIKAAYLIFYFVTTVILWFFQISWQFGVCCVISLFFITFFYEGTWHKRIWLTLAFSGVEFACYVLSYLAAGRIFYVPETAVAAFAFLLCFILIQKTGMEEKESEEPDRKETILLLLIPGVSLIALFCLLNGYMKPDWVCAVCCGCILIANLSVFYLYHILLQNHYHIRQRDIYQQQTLNYRNQLEVIRESQERIRALRHDMKNHILHLQAQMQGKNFKEALEYLDIMKEDMKSPAEYAASGNEEIDSLLNYKIRKAKQMLHTVECKISIPSDTPSQSFDLNVILGNLLDNAIEAAIESERKWMNITMRADRGILLIAIANSCGKAPEREGERFCSTKNMAGEHGIGLQNVKRMVERQNGEITFEYANDIFVAKVMLYGN